MSRSRAKAKDTSLDDLFRKACVAFLPSVSELKRKGWVMSSDLAIRYGVSLSTVHRVLRKQQRMGKVRSVLARTEEGKRCYMWRINKK